MKQGITALLLIALLASVTACGSEAGTVDETTAGSEDATGTTAQEAEEYPWADLDCGGDSFTILNSTDNYGFYDALDVESTTGDRLDDAIYARNRALEDRYKFRL